MASDFFNPNTVCILCDKKTGLAKNKTKLGTVCLNCMSKLSKYNINVLNIKNHSIDDLKALLQVKIPTTENTNKPKTNKKNSSIKVGMRTPSLKKSLSARTTGSVKRKIKKSINPLYGKKGMGFIKDPKRSVKNKIYKKTTFSISDLFK